MPERLDHQAWEKLILRNLQNAIKDVSKDVQSTIRSISIPILVIETILITTLESLLEIVLILVTVYVTLIPVRSASVHGISVVVAATVIPRVQLTLSIALLISAVHSLS